MKLNKIILFTTLCFIIFVIGYSKSNLNDKKHEANVETLSTNTKNNTISKKDAIENVKKHLHKTGEYVPHIVEVDNIDGNYYIVHAYEIINNQGQSHTITSGWFHVNIYNGEVSNMMDN